MHLQMSASSSGSLGGLACPVRHRARPVRWLDIAQYYNPCHSRQARRAWPNPEGPARELRKVSGAPVAVTRQGDFACSTLGPLFRAV